MHLESDDELVKLAPTGTLVPSLHRRLFPPLIRPCSESLLRYTLAHGIHYSANRPAFRESGAAGGRGGFGESKL